MRLISSICVSIISTGLLAAAAGNMDVVQGRPVVNNVFIEGQGPFRFLIDTGAQSNQIDAALGRSLGLTPSFRVELATASGTRMVPGCWVKSTKITETEAKDQEFLLTDLQGVKQLDRKIAGVVGQAFLSRFDYSIDFRAHRLEFGAVEAEGTRIAAEVRDGSFSIATSEGRLILDSGTEALILFREGSGRASQVVTAAGFVAASSPESQPIQIAGKSYRPRATAFVPGSGAREAGLLPMSLFRRIFICNSGGYVVVPVK